MLRRTGDQTRITMRTRALGKTIQAHGLEDQANPPTGEAECVMIAAPTATSRGASSPAEHLLA